MMSPSPLPNSDPPSYNTSIQAKQIAAAAARQQAMSPMQLGGAGSPVPGAGGGDMMPPPPYPSTAVQGMYCVYFMFW